MTGLPYFERVVDEFGSEYKYIATLVTGDPQRFQLPGRWSPSVISSKTAFSPVWVCSVDSDQTPGWEVFTVAVTSDLEDRLQNALRKDNIRAVIVGTLLWESLNLKVLDTIGEIFNPHPSLFHCHFEDQICDEEGQVLNFDTNSPWHESSFLSPSCRLCCEASNELTVSLVEHHGHPVGKWSDLMRRDSTESWTVKSLDCSTPETRSLSVCLDLLYLLLRSVSATAQIKVSPWLSFNTWCFDVPNLLVLASKQFHRRCSGLGYAGETQ